MTLVLQTISYPAGVCNSLSERVRLSGYIGPSTNCVTCIYREPDCTTCEDNFQGTNCDTCAPVITQPVSVPHSVNPGIILWATLPVMILVNVCASLDTLTPVLTVSHVQETLENLTVLSVTMTLQDQTVIQVN